MSRNKGVTLAVSLSALLIVGIALLYVAPAFSANSGKPANSSANKTSTSAATAPAAAAPKTATPVIVATPKADAQIVVPAGAELYVAKKGESLPGLVHRYLPKTKWMTGSELETAIKQANPEIKGIWFKADQKIIVPGVLPADYKATAQTVPANFEARAIYLTATMAGSAKGLEIMKHWREVGGNSVVFDLKDSDGLIEIPFQHELSNDKYQPIRNVAKLVNYIHGMNMHAIARIAIFRDEYLVEHHPELAVQSRKNGGAWKENGKLVWTDPSNPKVQEYNIALAKYAAMSGVDEVQFDYVRFPAEGDQKDAKFHYESVHPDWQRADVIANFLGDAHKVIQGHGVLFSIDVFGVMAWQRPVDLSHTGQDIVRMAKQVDVMSPMIYPSHFYGMDGYKTPGDAPEHFIGESMDRFKLTTKDSGVVLRPWLQAFGWRTPSYSPEYIRTQVEVGKTHGGVGFLFWNARNDYAKPYTAMPEMSKAGAKYFRGDEVGKPVPHATETKSADAKSGATKQAGL
jgi:hypothetical protein